MKIPRTFGSDDFQRVIAKFTGQFQFAVSNSELVAALAEVTAVRPDNAALMRVRQLIVDARQPTLDALSDRIGPAFESPPKLREVTKAIELAGYPATKRRICKEVHDLVLLKNAERWSNVRLSGALKKVKLKAGDKEMWEALQRVFDADSSGLGSILLRTFIIATRTGKMNVMDIPYLTSAITEKEMKSFAKATNFTVAKPRKPSA